LYLPFPQLVSLYLRIEPNSVVFDFWLETVDT
jgi:hypothetical protein